MSFGLSPQRDSITFDMTTGAEIFDFDVEDATCILDIHSNVAMDMGKFGLNEFLTHGNFSTWVSLDFNEGVAVTGMTSCGAVLIANQDFSRVAAGHMSGDARFVSQWCAKLLKGQVEPHFILWGTGPDGSRKTGGKLLLEYMRCFGISPSRAPAVASCGAIFLVRSQRGVASASYTIALPFKRRGQAVRESKPMSELATLLGNYHNLKLWNTDDLGDQYAMIKAISEWIGYGVNFPITFDDEAMTRSLSLHGKQVARALLTRLPDGYKDDFRSYEIFRLHPEWLR